LKIGSFSAASNVTGIVSDTCLISDLLHRYGALSFWDYAAAGPYTEIQMQPACELHPQAGKDAIFLSPHKFVGGPGTPGVLVANRSLFTNAVPVVPGGGTVSYVNPVEHHYDTNPERREEGGTPAIIESIRAGLVFGLKDTVGVDTIHSYEAHYINRAINVWSKTPNIQILGSLSAERLSIVSFVIRHGGRYLHHNFVVAVLNDLFGIQSRGGCSCAGPYGHRLLGINLDRSREFEREVLAGCEGIKPGWVRVNFNYFFTETVVDYIIQAVHMIADQGWKLLPDYTYDPATGLWKHHDGPSEPPLRLHQVTYGPDGRMRYPHHHDRAGDDVLGDYLRDAQDLFAAADCGSVGDTQVSGEQVGFDDLRWFELPEDRHTGQENAARQAAGL
jgi:selenocysteine lyase/cysteine desulfurase